MKNMNKRRVYLIVAIIFSIVALSTSLAYIIEQASAQSSADTIHGTEVSISVEIDDFSDQILIPQNAIATETGETKTLVITGTIALDYDTDIAVDVVLSYKILVDGDDETSLFNITDATTALQLDSEDGEDFGLKVALKSGEKLDDGAEITVVVTAELDD